MQVFPVPAAPILPRPTRTRKRSALIVSGDASFRQRLKELLSGLHWEVRVASGGAQAWVEAGAAAPGAVIVDSWLPDLDLGEFVRDFRKFFPTVEVVGAGAEFVDESPRGPHRNELLYALRRSQDTDTAAWNTAPDLRDSEDAHNSENAILRVPSVPVCPSRQKKMTAASERIPELIGDAACMLEVSRRIRLVARRSTPVLIEGPTGTGKELVAQALHRLSPRSHMSLVAINCAAIPEALLEAELFGHTRGAFTGAVQGREGRIEAADGGTLFLDEIGEMPLGLQAKLLRFVECGELQRVGDNQHVRVDVRILAATHCPLAQLAQAGNFRADLYYRLAVFLVHTPALADHMVDLPLLVEHFLAKMGRAEPIKRLSTEAMAILAGHIWPGNVRELEHVLERAAILAGEDPVLTAREIDFGAAAN